MPDFEIVLQSLVKIQHCMFDWNDSNANGVGISSELSKTTLHLSSIISSTNVCSSIMGAYCLTLDSKLRMNASLSWSVVAKALSTISCLWVFPSIFLWSITLYFSSSSYSGITLWCCLQGIPHLFESDMHIMRSWREVSRSHHYLACDKARIQFQSISWSDISETEGQ